MLLCYAVSIIIFFLIVKWKCWIFVVFEPLPVTYNETEMKREFNKWHLNEL